MSVLIQLPARVPLPTGLQYAGERLTLGTQKPIIDPSTGQAYPFQLPAYEVDPIVSTAGQVVDYGVNMIQAQKLHAKGITGKGTGIFVLDTAGRFDHPDLTNARNDLGKNFSDDSGSDPLKDGHGHGHHCAGIAAAPDNDAGVLGIAPGAELIPVKVLNNRGSGTWQSVASGIMYVADLEYDGIKIISMSLGASSGNPVLEDAIKYALSKGVYIVAAAGNSGPREGTVGYPAKYDNVMAVGAVDKNERVAYFSSRGKEVDVVMAGVSVLSTMPDGSLGKMSGTSMATPGTAGAMALVLSQKQFGDGNEGLIKFLTDSKLIKDLGDPGRDTTYGAGLHVLPPYFG